MATVITAGSRPTLSPCPDRTFFSRSWTQTPQLKSWPGRLQSVTKACPRREKRRTGGPESPHCHASSTQTGFSQEGDDGEAALPPAMGPDGLQKFFEMNSGQWRGRFVQFDFQGHPIQIIPVALNAITYGKGDDSSLLQTLRVMPGRQDKDMSESVAGWYEYNIPEMNRFSVDSRQQVGFFEDEGAYAISHTTAEMLGEVLRVGVLGEDADKDDESRQGVKMPTNRPALVSEVCLSSPSSKSTRARAFHVLDPRGLIDTIAVFLEGQGGSPCPEVLEDFKVSQVLGEWDGLAKVCRSDLYGGSTEEQLVRTVYSADASSITVESTRGVRTLLSRGSLASNVLQLPGGLQTVFLPGGLSFTYPHIVPRGSSFFLESGWVAPGFGSRQRIIRTYDADGMVVSTSFVIEKKVK